jgi:hypothetical protein
MRTDRPSTSSFPNPEELILYALLVLIGAIPTGDALVQQASFGVEATLGVLMICAGVIGAIGYAMQARRSSTDIVEPQPSGPGSSLAGSRSR